MLCLYSTMCHCVKIPELNVQSWLGADVWCSAPSDGFFAGLIRESHAKCGLFAS